MSDPYSCCNDYRTLCDYDNDPRHNTCNKPRPHRKPIGGQYGFECHPGTGCAKVRKAPGPGVYSNYHACSAECPSGTGPPGPQQSLRYAGI